MIVELKKSVDEKRSAEIAEKLKAVNIRKNGHSVLVTPSSLKELPSEFSGEAAEFFVMSDDIQLASRNYKKNKA